jgi:hypothetical protein
LVYHAANPVDKIVGNRWIGCGKAVCTVGPARRQKE